MGWSRLKLAAWAVWGVWAVVAGIYGERFSLAVWVSFLVTFAVLEATALVRRDDADPALTEVIVGRIPSLLSKRVCSVVGNREVPAAPARGGEDHPVG